MIKTGFDLLFAVIICVFLETADISDAIKIAVLATLLLSQIIKKVAIFILLQLNRNKFGTKLIEETCSRWLEE